MNHFDFFTSDDREMLPECPTILDGRFLVPPYKNKMIERICKLPREALQEELRRAHYNTFQIKAKKVFINLLTDSGTSAMSQEQWGALMQGDESYAGSDSFDKLEYAERQVFGYRYLIPTHQGRGAEHISSKILITPKKRKKQWVPNNLYFTTSRFHQENAGGIWVDVSVPEASNPESMFPFKGNIDLSKLEWVIKKRGAENIPFVRIEACLNMAGGQPFSFENISAVSALCRKHGIFLLLDATRLSDNAQFIQEKESGWNHVPQKKIMRDICDLTDGCTMSCKKGHYANIGGFFAVNDEKLADKAKDLLVAYEGLDSYGGMAGRDMEAVAVGMYESTDEATVRHYLAQARYLGEELTKQDIPVAQPIGAHGVFINAKLFLPHIPQEEFPAQTLAAELYLEGGICSMERGIVSGQHGYDPYGGMELVRLTLPRRVYELAHIMYVKEVIERLYRRKSKIRGLRMTYEPELLRFFRARFEPIS